MSEKPIEINEFYLKACAIQLLDCIIASDDREHSVRLIKNSLRQASLQDAMWIKK